MRRGEYSAKATNSESWGVETKGSGFLGTSRLIEGPV